MKGPLNSNQRTKWLLANLLFYHFCISDAVCVSERDLHDSLL